GLPACACFFALKGSPPSGASTSGTSCTTKMSTSAGGSKASVLVCCMNRGSRWSTTLGAPAGGTCGWRCTTREACSVTSRPRREQADRIPRPVAFRRAEQAVPRQAPKSGCRGKEICEPQPDLHVQHPAAQRRKNEQDGGPLTATQPRSRSWRYPPAHDKNHPRIHNAAQRSGERGAL